jgi:hypothetical protein
MTGLDQPLAVSNSTTDQELILGTVLVDGEFLVAVYGYETAQNDYKLTLELGAAPPLCTRDALEPNDTPAQASALLPEMRDLVACGDPDWFVLPISKTTTWYVFVDCERPAELKVTAFAEDGTTELAQGELVQGGIDLLLVHPPGERFQVQVVGTGTGVPYGLSYIVE